MKYYLIAGEASGDLHGSNLIKNIKDLDTGSNIRCWGGDKMENAGANLVKHYKELAFMGFIEVIKNLRTILKNLAFCKKDIQYVTVKVVNNGSISQKNIPLNLTIKSGTTTLLNLNETFTGTLNGFESINIHSPLTLLSPKEGEGYM